MGSATDAMQLSGLLDGRACAALRAAVDAEHERACDTVDGASDHQRNLSPDELREIVGDAASDAIVSAARRLDVQRGGSGTRPLPIVEAFVRRYTPHERPWHPFHQVRAHPSQPQLTPADPTVAFLPPGSRGRHR